MSNNLRFKLVCSALREVGWGAEHGRPVGMGAAGDEQSTGLAGITRRGEVF